MTIDELSPLLGRASDHGRGQISQGEEIESRRAGLPIDEDPKLVDMPVGERLAYNDYTTIDWLQDLVQDSSRLREMQSKKGLRYRLASLFDQASGWIAAALIGVLTACVAFLVDVAEASVSDWKIGYCATNVFATREACCQDASPGPASVLDTFGETGPDCIHFKPWSTSFFSSYAIYLVFALIFGVLSASVTLLTKTSLPATAPTTNDKTTAPLIGKTMYMAAGSGIPEIKTILSGFVIPDFLSFRVLVVKGIGAIFAVATGMCLGKEGPFVHISTCVGWLVASQFPKYRDNGRKMREMLSAACAAGLSVAFGAPIGGVLFSYEEISTYFPRKTLWRALLCSLCAAVTLKALNPSGTGKLVLFETNYGTSYDAVHYLVFVLLGVAGGIFGGLFCRLNFVWSKWFRGFSIIKNHPVLEVFLVVLVTVLLQYPNPLTREPGDMIIQNLLVDCNSNESSSTWICQKESSSPTPSSYYAYLIHGTLAKLVLTIITFGIKVPSGVIIPALDAGAFFGRLVGQCIPSISPGIFAMVGAAAFLAGVSRMTISLCVIMFELTGELEYVVPHMIAILVAKWVADAIGKDSVYDLAQSILGHPFLDIDHAMGKVQRENARVEELVPPRQTMEEITVVVPKSGKVLRSELLRKLNQLKARGLMDAGLVLVDNAGHLLGYITQNELAFGLSHTPASASIDDSVRVLGHMELVDNGFDLTSIVDRTPLTISAAAPLEYAVEMFAKLGLRHLMVLGDGSGRLVGVIIKKRLVAYLDRLKHA
jgi:chloride channel 3/4/5